MVKVDVDCDDMESDSSSDVFSTAEDVKQGSSKEDGSKNSHSSASYSMLSSHAMQMGFYKINLGTKSGQRLHSIHMLILPLIPVGILLGQNTSNYISHTGSANEIINVEKQVNEALDLSILVQRLQEERAAVALNIFTGTEVTELEILQNYTAIDISDFSLLTVFNKTDTMLQNIKNWPQINWVNYFDTKLKFQIQHSIFRNKIRGGEATIFEVIDWYNKITSFLLDYISYSIHDSDVSEFYRYIISFKNLLRSLEYASKAGVYGLRYLATGGLDRVHYHSFIKNEILRNEYLNQTFNFIPSLREDYDNSIRSKILEEIYSRILDKNSSEIGNISYIVNYFSHQIQYQRNVRVVITKLANSIGQFVLREFQKYNNQKIWPLVLVILLLVFIPIVVYITLQASTSMFRYSTLYDEKVSIFKQEKKRNEKLLTELLPLSIIREMKRGQIPKPVAFNSVTVFLCDIVGFTNLSSESTAQQIIHFLNSLYNLFDSRLENYNVYKVETIGDAYMVASGIPVENESHASEIAKMALDIIAKVVTFEIQHKPGYRLRIRVGIHSGDCVGGVVGSKIPHYSIFGSTVDIAGQLEALSKPMKIQISETTKSLLDKDGTFSTSPRGSPLQIKGFGTFSTYWLLGRKADNNSSYQTSEDVSKIIVSES